MVRFHPLCTVHYLLPGSRGSILPLSGALLQLLRKGTNGHTELRVKVGTVYVIANAYCYFRIKNVESLCKDLGKKVPF